MRIIRLPPDPPPFRSYSAATLCIDPPDRPAEPSGRSVDQQLMPADHDPIPGPHLAPPDPLPIDQRAVGRLKIAQDPAAVAELQPGVVA